MKPLCCEVAESESLAMAMSVMLSKEMIEKMKIMNQKVAMIELRLMKKSFEPAEVVRLFINTISEFDRNHDITFLSRRLRDLYMTEIRRLCEVYPGVQYEVNSVKRLDLMSKKKLDPKNKRLYLEQTKKYSY